LTVAILSKYLVKKSKCRPNADTDSYYTLSLINDLRVGL